MSLKLLSAGSLPGWDKLPDMLKLHYNQAMTITIAIQAGGQSSRMKRDKGLVPLAGQPLIEHVLARVEGLGDEILVTTNRPADYAFLGLPTAADDKPGAGALVGLQTALRAANGEEVLVLACDMPFVNRGLVEHLLALAPEADVIIPRWAGRWQTLHAVYARRCLPAIEAALARGDMKMVSFLQDMRVREVGEAEVARFDPQGRSFVNINTPAELASAEQLLSEEGDL